MNATPPLSVVIPLYRTRSFLPDLLDRLATACPMGTEVVLVDDACPEQSWQAATEPSTDLYLQLLRLDHNVGQHAAVLVGLRAASGDQIVVMDGDLQDRPEAIPMLRAALVEDEHLDAVAAKRSGTYSSSGQRLTARGYRAAVTLLSRGRIEYGAGMFLVMRRGTCERVLALDDPAVPLVPGIGRTGMRVGAVRIPRDARRDGVSSHSGPARARIAFRGLLTLTPLYPPIRRRRYRRWRPPTVTTISVSPRPSGTASAP